MAKKSKKGDGTYGSMEGLRFGPRSVKGNPENAKVTNTGK